MVIVKLGHHVTNVALITVLIVIILTFVRYAQVIYLFKVMGHVAVKQAILN